MPLNNSYSCGRSIRGVGSVRAHNDTSRRWGKSDISDLSKYVVFFHSKSRVMCYAMSKSRNSIYNGFNKGSESTSCPANRLQSAINYETANSIFICLFSQARSHRIPEYPPACNSISPKSHSIFRRLSNLGCNGACLLLQSISFHVFAPKTRLGDNRTWMPDVEDRHDKKHEGRIEDI